MSNFNNHSVKVRCLLILLYCALGSTRSFACVLASFVLWNQGSDIMRLIDQTSLTVRLMKRLKILINCQNLPKTNHEPLSHSMPNKKKLTPTQKTRAKSLSSKTQQKFYYFYVLLRVFQTKVSSEYFVWIITSTVSEIDFITRLWIVFCLPQGVFNRLLKKEVAQFDRLNAYFLMLFYYILILLLCVIKVLSSTSWRDPILWDGIFG